MLENKKKIADLAIYTNIVKNDEDRFFNSL